MKFHAAMLDRIDWKELRLHLLPQLAERGACHIVASGYVS
jgi:hypothetical protein